MMMKKGFVKQAVVFFVFSAVLFFLFPSQCPASQQGFRIVRESQTILEGAPEPIAGQIILEFTEERVRMETDQDKNSVLLIHMDEGKIYQLDIKTKRYQEVKLHEGLDALYAGNEMKSSKLDKTKKVGDWECYGIRIDTKTKEIALEAEYWLSKEVDIPVALREKVAKYFGHDQKRLTEELAKYEGYPMEANLVIKANDKQIKMVTIVKEIKRMEIDPKRFEIPPDFKEVEVAQKAPGIEKGDPNKTATDVEKGDPNKTKKVD